MSVNQPIELIAFNHFLLQELSGYFLEIPSVSREQFTHARSPLHNEILDLIIKLGRRRLTILSAS